MPAKFGKSFVIIKKTTIFVAEKMRKEMKHLIILLLAALLSQTISAQTAKRDSVSADRRTRIDTLRQVEVRADSMLRVNESIRKTIERERKARIGTASVSDILGSNLTDKIMHPFAVKERRREKKHARDRKILEKYEELGRVKTFEELLDEAIRQQAIEDGKEPPTKK